MRDMIEAVGATLLCLAAYSQDLNLIELAHLRAAAATMVPSIVRRIGRVLATFGPQDCTISSCSNVTGVRLRRDWP